MDFVNAVDFRRNQQRQIQLMKLRAELSAPQHLASELATAGYQTQYLERRVAKLTAENEELKKKIEELSTTVCA